MTIYLDFDGTVVEHEWPKIGRCNFGCIEVIKKLQDAGHTIIINTMRSEFGDGTMQQAIKWFDNYWMVLKDKNYENFNLDVKKFRHLSFKKDPGVWDIKQSIKDDVLMIDDQCRGIPLKKACMTKGYMVDWDELDKIFTKNGLY